MSLKPPERVEDERDDNGTIWHDDGFHRDAWVVVANDQPLPASPAIVSKPRWLKERATLASRTAPLGLWLDAGEGLDDIAEDLARFAIVALNFPKYSDGRAFSTATLLREKYAFRGELRAVGNVLNDQIPLMQRVGFDSLAVAHAPTRAALVANRLAAVHLYYQPAVRSEAPAGTRPWLRRVEPTLARGPSIEKGAS